MSVKYDLPITTTTTCKERCFDVHYTLHSWATELKSPYLWRAVAAEFLGTGILVLLCVGSTVSIPGSTPTSAQISLATGLATQTSIWMIGHLSQAHINPAITTGILANRKISLIRAVFYIIAQCGGSIVATILIKVLTPSALRGNLGATLVNPELTAVQGLFVEMIITVVLMMSACATMDEKRGDLHGSGALTMGLVVTVCHLFAINYTGASMNPAASLGPAVVMNIWTNFWVYIVRPVSGAVLGSLMYEHLFAANASWKKTRAFLSHSKYESSQF